MSFDKYVDAFKQESSLQMKQPISVVGELGKALLKIFIFGINPIHKLKSKYLGFQNTK